MRLGLDIGGTKIEAVALGDGDEVLATLRVPTGHGPEAVLASAVSAATQVAGAAGAGGYAISSIGVGIPGVVDAATGRVRHAVNLGLEDLALGALLTARLGAPAAIENDVNAAAVGAYHLLGLGGSMAYLNLGTGVAAGIVLDGALWRGARGTAGEVGHVPVDPDGELCNCGQRGCLETLASGGWLERRWPMDAPVPALDLFDRAEAGEPDALEVRELVAAGAAAGVRLLVLALDVESVVIGGGLSRLGERLLAPVRAALDRQAAASPFLASLGLSARVRLAPADIPVPAIGAALVGAAPEPHDREDPRWRS